MYPSAHFLFLFSFLLISSLLSPLILAYPDARPAARPIATLSPSPEDTHTLHPRAGALYRYFKASDPDCHMCNCDDNGKVLCPMPDGQTQLVPDKCYFANRNKKYCTKMSDATSDTAETKDATTGDGKLKKGTVAGGGVMGGRVGKSKSTRTRPQAPKAQKAVGDVDGNAKVMDWLGSQG